MHGNESYNTDENRLKVAEKSEKDERAFKIKGILLFYIACGFRSHSD